MSKELIIAPAIQATPDTASIVTKAVSDRKALLDRYSHITGIVTIGDRDDAVRLAKEIAGHLKELEDSRVAIKEPYLEMCRKIDGVAKEHRAELEAAARQIGNKVGEFNEQQRRLKEEEDRRIREEQQRIENERQKLEQERKEREEKEAAAKRKPTAAQSLRKELEEEEREEQLEAERKRLDQERLDLAERNRQTASFGGAQRTEIDIEVTDIRALYAAQPTCVRLTADLVQLKWIINNRPELLPLPGVTFTKRPVFSARSK